MCLSRGIADSEHTVVPPRRTNAGPDGSDGQPRGCRLGVCQRMADTDAAQRNVRLSCQRRGHPATALTTSSQRVAADTERECEKVVITKHHSAITSRKRQHGKQTRCETRITIGALERE